MPKVSLALLTILLYALHQDFWFWRSAYLVFGFLPIGIFYHACYSLAAAGLMYLLVRHAWPANVDVNEDPRR